MCYLPNIFVSLFSATHGGTDKFECAHYNGYENNSFSTDMILGYVGTPDNEYHFKSFFFFNVGRN